MHSAAQADKQAAPVHHLILARTQPTFCTVHVPPLMRVFPSPSGTGAHAYIMQPSKRVPNHPLLCHHLLYTAVLLLRVPQPGAPLRPLYLRHPACSRHPSMIAGYAGITFTSIFNVNLSSRCLQASGSAVNQKLGPCGKKQ